jgi:hypothetical protein
MATTLWMGTQCRLLLFIHHPHGWSCVACHAPPTSNHHPCTNCPYETFSAMQGPNGKYLLPARVPMMGTGNPREAGCYFHSMLAVLQHLPGVTEAILHHRNEPCLVCEEARTCGDCILLRLVESGQKGVPDPDMDQVDIYKWIESLQLDVMQQDCITEFWSRIQKCSQASHPRRSFPHSPLLVCNFTNRPAVVSPIN